MISNAIPVINTSRLILRRIVPSDAPALFDLFSQDCVTQYTNLESLKDLKEAEDLITSCENEILASISLRWAITLNAAGDDKLIGTCGLLNFSKENNRAEVGYDLNPIHWGLGIATEATKAMVEYGFDTLQLHRIEANVEPANPPSKKVLTKLGFEFEATLRDYFFEKGRYIDIEMYSILNSNSSQ